MNASHVIESTDEYLRTEHSPEVCMVCKSSHSIWSQENKEQFQINNAAMEGVKNDSQKIQLELLSSSWLLGVGAVLTFGAKKYAAHNWRKGIQLSRLLGAALRHVLAFLGGQDRDEETGLSHLYHASCCLMFASELYETMPAQVDDRYKGPDSCALKP